MKAVYIAEPGGLEKLIYGDRPDPEAGAGEVLATFTIGRMMHRVLVENWPVEKSVEEAHKKVAEIYARHHKG